MIFIIIIIIIVIVIIIIIIIIIIITIVSIISNNKISYKYGRCKFTKTKAYCRGISC